MPLHEKNSRTQQGSGDNRRITIGGDVINSVVVEGDNNNVIVNQSNQRPTIKLYTSPIMVGRPAKPPALLDRESERNTVQNALTSGGPVEFYATEGFGKTALIRYLSALLQLPDGIVYLPVKNQSLDDLLQNLFNAFYQCTQNYKPSLVEYTRYFEKIHALIFLDDVTLTRDEIQDLSSYLPACVFIFSSSERRLWDQGNSIHLSGLPADAAVNLFQQKISRTLSDEEKIVAAKICAALQNNPLHIIQAAAVGSELKEYPSEDSLYSQVLTSLPDSEKKALALLAAIGSAPLPVEHIAAILNEKNPQGALDDLMQRGLVEAHSPRYSAAEGFGRYLTETWDIPQWRDAVLRYFIDWSSRPILNNQVLDAAEALFAVLGNTAAQERWREVLQIGRAIESALVFSGQWDMWVRLLNLLLQASRALGDQFVEAWVLHQMGSRALCLKDAAQAQELLSRALEIRKTIGDKAGIKATQHNLDQSAGGASSGKPPHGPGGSRSGGRWIGPVIGTIVVLAALAAWLVPAPYNPIKPTFTPTPSITPVWTPTSTLTPSITPTYTFTPTPIISSLDVNVSIPDVSKQSPMLYQGIGQADYFEMPVNISIVDKGPIDIKNAFSFSLYFSGSDGVSHTIDFRLNDKPTYQSDIYEQSIAVGQTIPILLWAKIPIEYQGSKLSISARVSECERKEIMCDYHDGNAFMPKVVFDFVAYAPRANWYGIDPNSSGSNSSPLKFGGSIKDDIGSAAFEDSQLLENKSQPDEVLRTHPRWVVNGRVAGVYDLTSLKFEKGDLLAIRVGYLDAAGQSDGVTFSVNCQAPISIQSIPFTFLKTPNIGNLINLKSVQDSNDGFIKDVVVPLPDSVISGKCPYFYLIVDAGKFPDSDWTVWVSAFIERPSKSNALIPIVKPASLLHAFAPVPANTPAPIP